MNICVIGTGYVGLVAGACLADMGNYVICVDNNEEKLSELKNGKVPIFEPTLEEIVKTNLKENRLSFSSDLDFAVKNSNVCFIAVGTPQDEDGSADIKHVLNVAKKIAISMNNYKVIVNKSTVPVGTAEKIQKIIKENTKFDFDIVSNPEFLKQGNAVDDFLSPDRVIIGSDSKRATTIMQEIYAPFLRTGNRVIVMDVKSAEMTKYAANSFLATKISFINEIANLCEKVGADVHMVRDGICADSRIGNKFLFPGLGFGGSCFPKDIKALIKTGYDNNLDMQILKSVELVNTGQRLKFVEKITSIFGSNLNGSTFAVWGLSFKPKTDDMREAPSIVIIEELLKKGATIKAFDPKAMQNAKKIFGDKIIYSNNAYDACVDADCLLLLTEWNEFRRPDFNKIKSLMKKQIIFDGRNQYEENVLSKIGFKYFCIGKR
ncbi:MAG: UDP-glucose/GDP-mannose dehydrogenase family protein [Candidatus Gastranaerophilales bacterium]|nr:UDP-glucose/GDP-mannose dehydrogenase family protein [Candidatus Gastranaerophilales bacterium]